jgi:hypothetical protein
LRKPGSPGLFVLPLALAARDQLKRIEVLSAGVLLRF